MTRVVAIILHAVPGPDAGPLERSFADVRAGNADTQARGFADAGAEVRIVETVAGGDPFGRRLLALARDWPGAGLVVFGSGSIPLARPGDRTLLVAAAAAGVRSNGDAPATQGIVQVLANNRFSADILAIPPSVDLDSLPDLGPDNGVPRWLAGRGVTVRDLRRRWHLQVDLDSPMDAILTANWFDRQTGDEAGHAARVLDALARARAVTADPSAELLVAGRTSADTLRWVERQTASRTRALIEERGLRTAGRGQRATRSSLGLLLDRDGPEAVGDLLAELSDAALVDSRVLMAHRFGRDEAAWPDAEDRFASDLLLHERIRDPWLRALTRAAASAPIPILLGGHTLVGPGLRLAIRTPRR